MADLEDIKAIDEICDRVRPILAGKPSHLQGAALADLLATWLAGHIAKDHPQETDRFREELLAAHIEHVRRLIPVNAEHIHGRARSG